MVSFSFVVRSLVVNLVISNAKMEEDILKEKEKEKGTVLAGSGAIACFIPVCNQCCIRTCDTVYMRVNAFDERIL